MDSSSCLNLVLPRFWCHVRTTHQSPFVSFVVVVVVVVVVLFILAFTIRIYSVGTLMPPNFSSGFEALILWVARFGYRDFYRRGCILRVENSSSDNEEVGGGGGVWCNIILFHQP